MIDEHDRDIAARAREAMRAAGMTQHDLVNYMQIAPDRLSKSLRGKRRFSSLEVALIAEATGTSTDRLLGIRIDVTGWHDGYTAACEDAAREADRGYMASERCDDIAARIRALPSMLPNQTVGGDLEPIVFDPPLTAAESDAYWDAITEDETRITENRSE